jgi:peptide/nickel transport system substrate-binding protein
VAGLLVAALFLAGCGSPSVSESTASPSALPVGGTLRLAVPHDIVPPSALASSDAGIANNALDPHFLPWYDSQELQRCCLNRTLLSYAGFPTDRDGTVLRPDLAASLPEVSGDELTWTFHVRPGIHYAPPLEDVEVTSADFVRMLHRVLPGHARLSGFATLTQLGIVGVSEFLAGDASTVSGVETPDPYTLRIRLVRPAGDLPARFAVSDTAPIPPSPSDAAAPLGIATGHDEDYGRFMVGTGPYMVEGSERMDLTLPPGQQVPAAGYVPGTSLTLVRNPAWDPATDDLRPAYVDRIEIAIGGTLEDASARVDDGEIDFVFNAGSPPQSPATQIDRYYADPNLGQVYTHSRDILRYVEMNLALPPLDDIHVRRAINLVIDKAGLIELAGERTGTVAGHMVLDSLEDNLLLGYDPYRTTGSHGDPGLARDEMSLSPYDADGDGRCDAPACVSVEMVTFRLTPEEGELVVANLAEIGITAEISGTFPPDDVIGPFHDPQERIGLLVGGPWAKDTLNAAHFFRAVFDSAWSMSDDFTNGNMVGTSRERLESWGYEPIDLPNVDERIVACLRRPTSAQVQCWAELDQYLMENVVPWVPLVFEGYTHTVSNRVVHYSFDQSVAQPALDQIAVGADD